MNRPFPDRRLILVLLVLPWLSGCLQTTREVVVAPERHPRPETPLSGKHLDGKVAYLKGLLESEALSTQDRELASNLLAAYETLRSGPRDASGGYDYPRITRLLFENLNQLDELYFAQERPRKGPAAGDFREFAAKRKKIVEDYLYGEYQAVINGCLELESSFGAEALTPELSTILALSLAERGFTEEALSMAELLVYRMKGRPGLLALQAHMIQWQVDLGKREKALRAYDRLSEELDDIETRYRGLQSALAQEGFRAPAAAPFPPGPAADAASLEPAGPLDDILAQAEALAERQEFQKARLLLIRHRIRVQEGPEAGRVDQALKKIESLQGQTRERPEPEDTRDRETLNLARRLIQEERYEEALTQLGGVEDTPALQAEIEELNGLAQERLINSERNRAAEYFLLARNTTDPQKKKELLLSSHKILNTLVDKYPKSPLIEKVNDHIRKVKEALAELGAQPE